MSIDANPKITARNINVTSFRLPQSAMTRHGKNCTAGAVYTYHEKRKDTGEARAHSAVPAKLPDTS